MATEDGNHQIIREELARVLSSAAFARNERLSRFLRYLVERHLEGRDEEIKESLIGVEVFGRRPDYDPKVDSIVRTEAGRLRARLVEYYAHDGGGDATVIEVPKGRYVPRFQSRNDPDIFEKATHVGRLRLIAAFAILVALAAVSWIRVGSNAAPIRIAVLPLENLSPQKADEYFADGLTDEITGNLSILEGLAVRSRTSSFAFKGQPRDIRDAARQLDVDYILEGSVERAPGRVRVHAQLVRVRDDLSVWSGSFDRALTDVLAIQDEICRGIVNNLRLQLGRGRRRYETSVDAYDLYLRGRALSQQNSPHRFQSLGYFEQAAAKDPSFAPAYAALASVYAHRSIQFVLDHPADELAKMRNAAEKAIELDPLLAEAHDALGMMYAREGEWQQAEKSFRHAIELDPNRSMTYDDFGVWLLYVLGRNQEALQQLRLAEKADPLSPAIHAHLGSILISAKQYDEAERSCLKLPIGNFERNTCLARAKLGQGYIGEALQFLAADARYESPGPEANGFVGYVYAKAGRRDEAERELAAASHDPNAQALILAGLGDKDRIFEALDRMDVLGPQRIGIHLNYPELAFLRGDPREQLLRQKVGLLR
jgi:TolB-like protein/Flp pilus assembly protein TadD